MSDNIPEMLVLLKSNFDEFYLRDRTSEYKTLVEYCTVCSSDVCASMQLFCQYQCGILTHTGTEWQSAFPGSLLVLWGNGEQQKGMSLVLCVSYIWWVSLCAWGCAHTQGVISGLSQLLDLSTVHSCIGTYPGCTKELLTVILSLRVHTRDKRAFWN